MNLALSLGRYAACCVHPFAAWRGGSIRRRGAIVVGYAAGAYVVTFVSLWLSAS
jgi:hypothetical protein